MHKNNGFSYPIEFGSRHTSRILIIEHSESLSNLYKSILLQDERKILLASCGREALTMLTSFCPNLIITPSELLDMNSDQLRKQVSAQSSQANTPILVLSTKKKIPYYPTNATNDNSETLFLPFRINDLRNSVQNILQKQEVDNDDLYYSSRPQSVILPHLA